MAGEKTLTTDEENTKPFRVLSLDGGGMRGLYTAAVLQTLSNRFNQPGKEYDLGSRFDLIAGTSTGGILSCAIAAGKPLAKIVELYAEHGRSIFPRPIPNSTLGKILWAVWNWRTPPGNREVLRQRLENVFGNETIRELYERRKIALCIPAVNLSTRKAWVFKTPHTPQKTRDDLFSLAEVCLATSAAPLILPVSQLGSKDIAQQSYFLVDGGLWANNPVLVALTEALLLAKPNQNIEIVSVGTCPPPTGDLLTSAKINRGVVGWSVGIGVVEVSIDAQASGHDFIARFLAQSLSSPIRQITLARLPANPPSGEQAKVIGLDKASKASIDTLLTLGAADGNSSHGVSLQGSSRADQAVRDAFSDLPLFSN